MLNRQSRICRKLQAAILEQEAWVQVLFEVRADLSVLRMENATERNDAWSGESDEDKDGSRGRGRFQVRADREERNRRFTGDLSGKKRILPGLDLIEP